MSWSDGLWEHYQSKLRGFTWFWAVASALVLLCWLVHVVPYRHTHTGIVSKGVVVARGCGKSLGVYTYSYQVDGQSYTGKTRLAGLDGNGACEQLVPGSVVSITYRQDDPARSMAGTFSSWSKMAVHYWIGIAFMSFILPILLSIKPLRREG
jgi:hypothetical protein